MKLIAWLFLTVYPQHKCYNISAVRYTKKDFSMSFPLCKCVRSMPAIGANGNIYPCMQMSGYFEMNGVRLGNVLTGGLSGYLRDGSYHDIVYTTICEKIEKNEKCRTCPYLTYCGTGCPALSLLYTGSFDGVNPIMCTFYENGWYQKIKDALPDLKNLSEIDL